MGIFISSFIFGAVLWLGAFVLTYSIWGLLAVIVGLFLFGIGVVPIALIATAIHGFWSPFWDLIITILCTLGARLIGILILGSVGERDESAAGVNVSADG